MDPNYNYSIYKKITRKHRRTLGNFDDLNDVRNYIYKNELTGDNYYVINNSTKVAVKAKEFYSRLIKNDFSKYFSSVKVIKADNMPEEKFIPEVH